MNLKVTVLMALYNGGKYLKQTIQSVLDQTYRNFELLIINDCSTDNSLDVINGFADERIRVYNNLGNIGQTPSLNIGLNLAKGEYIARMDADDIALPQWLNAQMKYVEEHEDFSVVSSYALAVDEHNKLKKVYKPPFNEQDIILRSLIAPPIHHVGSVFKTKDIVENGGYNERYIFAADYALWEKLINNGLKITTNPRILVAIREHMQSVSKSGHHDGDLVEIREIVGRNIKKFTTAGFTAEEIDLFCRANYDEGKLTASEFNKAFELTKKAYMSLAPEFKIKTAKKTRWARQRCMTICLKRIFHFMAQRSPGTVRGLSRKAMKEFGAAGIFTGFWAVSLLGGRVLSCIPGFYHSILRYRACLQAGPQRGVGVFR